MKREENDWFCKTDSQSIKVLKKKCLRSGVFILLFKSGIHRGGADNQLFPKNLQKMVYIKHSISIISPIKNQQVCALWSRGPQPFNLSCSFVLSLISF